MLVSIIVPVFNVEKYLADCLNSILNQTINDYEIICINDGSTDGSYEILKSFLPKFKSMTIINQSNKGLGAARNVGVNIAKGEYIFFVDSDDFIKSNCLEVLTNRAKCCNSDVVISNPLIYDNLNKKIAPYRNVLFFLKLYNKHVFCAKENPEVLKLIGCWDKIYRREFIINNRLKNPENRIYEDAVFSYMTLCLAKSISVVKECVYYYRKNTGNSITDCEGNNDNYKIDFLKNIYDIYQFLSDNNFLNDFKKIFLGYIFYNGQYQYKSIKKRKVKKIFVDVYRKLLKKMEFNFEKDISDDFFEYVGVEVVKSNFLCDDDVLKLNNIKNNKTIKFIKSMSD